MEVYTTENEQIDAIRRFFAEYGKSLAVGLIIGIGALAGWRYWQHYQSTTLMDKSATYQQLTDALNAPKTDSVAAMQHFAQENRSVYGTLAALDLAHHFVEKGDLAQAEQQLAQALTQTKDSDLLALVALRLARVQQEQKKWDDSLKTLDQVKGESWSALAQNLRGDALLAKGNTQGARDAYTKALDTKASQSLQIMLRTKLNNLSS